MCDNGSNAENNRRYWNDLASEYQAVTRISCDRFHLGPLVADGETLGVLPAEVRGQRCLEIGCGAGQNSIVLARRGAHCTALDVAERQVETGRRLADGYGIEIDWRVGPMETTPFAEWGPFDLVHSTYALPFADDPAAVVTAMGEALAPGGLLLLTVGHPVFAGEWLEIEEEGEGIFLTDYFHPPADARFGENDELVCARYYPIGTVIGWLADAGLRLERLVEPQALPIPTMTEAEIEEQIPYDSPWWRELYPQLAKVPAVATFVARR